MRRRVQVGKPFDLSVSLTEKQGNSKKAEQKAAPRHVAVGREFEFTTKIALKGDLSETRDAETRSQIVWFAFAVIALFLLGAAALGLYQGEFGAIQQVWSVAGPIYGGIAGYYFSRHGKK
jgi:hypothetical protein